MKLATSSKDTNTILWDMNTAKKTQELKITNNKVTDMIWSSDHNYVFYQTSKDLRLRIYDTRDPLNVTITTKIDDSYATSMDIDDTGHYLITGHHGLNNNN
jgi:WD40 repeat protein